jgi:nitroreductase
MQGVDVAPLERPLSTLDAIYGRRSVRSFAARPLERSTIRALLDAAVQAPTAMHEQPWLFVVVQDPHVLKDLSDRVKATWADEAVARSVPHARGAADLHAAFVKQVEDPAFDVFYGAAALVIICARRLDRFVVADCWLAAENLILAACALGLGTCCIGAAVDTIEAPDTKMALGIPADVHAVAPIVVGVPAGTPAPSARREPQVIAWK